MTAEGTRHDPIRARDLQPPGERVDARVAGDKRARRFRLFHHRRPQYAALSWLARRGHQATGGPPGPALEAGGDAHPGRAALRAVGQPLPRRCAPAGQRYLKGFRLDPFPVFSYVIDGIELEKSVFMVHGENSTVIEYKLVGHYGGSAQLEVRPLIAFRDYHSTTRENGALNADVQIASGSATVEPYRGLPALHLAHDADELEPAGSWYRNFEYDVERERGLDFVEDLFSPFVFTSAARTAAKVL
jgi:Glycogen debranching enzyme N terminal